MTRCDYCHEPFEPKRPGQRFCNTPGKSCRQKWHAENQHPAGIVHGVYQRPSGGWSVVIHYPRGQLPKVERGDSIKIECSRVSTRTQAETE